MKEATRPISPELYTIGVAARLTGISAGTLRSWERRHGAIQPVRSEAGHRRYTKADLQRLSLLSSLVRHGHAISDLAALSDQQLRSLTEGRALRPARGGRGAQAGSDPALAHVLDAHRFRPAGLPLALAGQSGALICGCPRHLSHALLQLSDVEGHVRRCNLRNSGADLAHRQIFTHMNAARSELEAALKAASQTNPTPRLQPELETETP